MRKQYPEDEPDQLDRLAYLKLLAEAKEVSVRTLEKLRALHDHFSTGFSSELIELLELTRSGSVLERRKALRFGAQPTCAAVANSEEGAWFPARVSDLSQDGLALCLRRPAEVGDVLLVRLDAASQAAWVPVEVKHCHAAAEGWIVGCSVLGSPLVV